MDNQVQPPPKPEYQTSPEDILGVETAVPVFSTSDPQPSPEDSVSQQLSPKRDVPLRKRIWVWLRKHPITFILTVMLTVSSTWVGMAVTNILDPSCRWVPIPMRSIPIVFFFCTPPIVEGATESDFVLVFVGLHTTENSLGGQVLQASSSVDRILQSYADSYNGLLEDGIGGVYVVSSNNSWVEVVPIRDPDTNDRLQTVADRFQITDLVLYGEVTGIDSGIQRVNLRGYTPRQKQILDMLRADLLLVSDDAWNYDFGEILIFEGGQEGQAQPWISGIRELTIGLQKQSDTTLRPMALMHFENLAISPIPQLSAIGYLYVGNFLLDDAFVSQSRDQQACLGGEVCNISNETIELYERASDAYIKSLLASPDDGDIRFRALIGRGNVHYRFAQITPDTTLGSDVDIANYDCMNDGVFPADSDEPSQTFSRGQHAEAAIRCFDQASEVSNPVVALRAFWGRAEVFGFLGEHQAAANEYTRIIASSSSITRSNTPVGTSSTPMLDRQGEIITALAYGELGVIRLYNLQNVDINDIKEDFKNALCRLGSNLPDVRERYLSEWELLTEDPLDCPA